MTAHVYPNPQEKVISGAGTFAMHLLFIALLVFGVNWQKKVEPQANIVDLWTDLPSPVQPKIEPPPPPPPRPVVLPKIEPAPPPKAVAKPEVAKPDIALKEKAEKARRQLEEQKKDAKKREEEKQQQQQQQQAREAAEAQRLAKEQEEAQRKLAEQVAAAQAKLRAEYMERIRAKIRSRIVAPPSLQGNPRVEFSVTVLSNGAVFEIKPKIGSGNAAWDSAVERAIRSAQPLPLPPDPALAKDFRDLDLGFRPQD